MKHIALTLLSLLIIGCQGTPSAKQDTFIEDNVTGIVFAGHNRLCQNEPDDMFCTTYESTGDIQPLWGHVKNITEIANNYFTYKSEEVDTWKYNLTIEEELIGDCDDMALTLAYYFIEEMGIDRKHVILGVTYSEKDTYHIFVGVNTRDKGWSHFDYDNSGYAMEQLNHHMLMTDVNITFRKGDFR